MSLPKDLRRTDPAFARFAIFQLCGLAQYLDPGVSSRAVGWRRMSLELDDKRLPAPLGVVQPLARGRAGANKGASDQHQDIVGRLGSEVAAKPIAHSFPRLVQCATARDRDPADARLLDAAWCARGRAVFLPAARRVVVRARVPLARRLAIVVSRLHQEAKVEAVDLRIHRRQASSIERQLETVPTC